VPQVHATKGLYLLIKLPVKETGSARELAKLLAPRLEALANLHYLIDRGAGSLDELRSIRDAEIDRMVELIKDALASYTLPHGH
jgi:hypothetical protein